MSLQGARSGGNLVVPATIFVVAGLLGPMLLLLRYSFNLFVPGQFMVEGLTLDNYIKFFTDPYYYAVLGRTVRVAVVCTVVCLAGGFPLAYVLARTQSRYKNLLVIAIVLPLFVGNAVRSAGWMVAFGNKGALNSALMGLGWIDAPWEIMYTETAVIFGIISVNLPFMVLSLQGVIEGIGRHLEEAAFNLGAPPSVMFRRVLWPLAVPGISAGTILTFILAMNAYATPVLLGGPKFQMMGPLVFDQFLQQNNWPFGGAVAFILMAVTLVLSAAANLLVSRRRVD
jgi:putative spermidine/putrescine transport system permease protein